MSYLVHGHVAPGLREAGVGHGVGQLVGVPLQQLRRRRVGSQQRRGREERQRRRFGGLVTAGAGRGPRPVDGCCQEKTPGRQDPGRGDAGKRHAREK